MEVYSRAIKLYLLGYSQRLSVRSIEDVLKAVKSLIGLTMKSLVENICFRVTKVYEDQSAC